MQKRENGGNLKTSNNDRYGDTLRGLTFFGNAIIQPLFYAWRRVFQISNKPIMCLTDSKNIFSKRMQTMLMRIRDRLGVICL